MEFKTTGVTRLETDVLVLGSGAAGCGAALAAREQGAEVILADKGKLESSGCLGGGNDHFQAVLESSEPHDTLEDFIRTTYSPTLGVSQAMVEAWGKVMPKLVSLLEDAGVNLLHREDGSYLRTGGFGDPGKWYINVGQGYRCKSLIGKTVRKAGVQVLDHVMITSIIKQNGRVAGAMGYNVREGGLIVIRAKVTVLAMGNFANRAVPNSSGNPYNTWHNPFNTGSQYVLAYRAGARLLNLDLRQNVTLVPKGFGCAGMNGITGAGAHELNARGERFMPRYHPGGELSPRHFQIRGTSTEQTEGSGPPFYMDLRHVPADELRHLNNVLMPGDKATWLDYIAQKGIDLSKELLEVEFSEIEFGGLVETADDFSTRVPGLFNACVFYGFSGALCGGWLAGLGASRAARSTTMPDWPSDDDAERERERVFRPLGLKNGVPQAQFESAIRQIMSYYMGLVRNEQGMNRALERLEYVSERTPLVTAANPHELMLAHESFMLLESSRLATLVSVERRETGRTTWRRSDYPKLDPALNCVLAVENHNGKPCVVVA